MKTLRVVSNKPRHAALVRKNGSHVINGITFRRIDGDIAAEVSEAEARIFGASEGFSIYSEDGKTHLRTCGQTTRLSTADVAAARGVEVASATDTLSDLLRTGQLTTDDVLAALAERGMTLPTAPAKQEEPQLEQSTTPAPKANDEEDGQDDENLGDIDETDADQVVKLPRTQLFGLARAYGVECIGSGRTHRVIAEDIAAAAKAAAAEQDENKKEGQDG